jgi:hypothetical protein
MLDAMVATQGFDLIVTIAWVGVLTAFLLGRALISWHRFRRTSAFARQARRLSEATRSMAIPRSSDRMADVIPLRDPAPTPARQKSKI